MQQQHQNPARSFPVTFAFWFGESFGETATRRSIRRRVRRGIRRSDHAAALGTLSSGFRANALLLRNCAVGLWALGLYTPAQLLHNSPFSRSLSSLRALAKSLPGSGYELRSLRSAASARLKSPGGSKSRVPRPTGDLFPRFAQSYPGRQSGALRASTKHRIGRVWERSLRYRSLGLAIASAVTGSVSTRVLPSPCFAWGLRITALRPWGACAIFCSVGAKVLCLCSVARATACTSCAGERANMLALRKRIGLRALTLSKPQPSTKPGSILVQTYCTTKPSSKPDQM